MVLKYFLIIWSIFFTDALWKTFRNSLISYKFFCAYIHTHTQIIQITVYLNTHIIYILKINIYLHFYIFCAYIHIYTQIIQITDIFIHKLYMCYYIYYIPAFRTSVQKSIFPMEWKKHKTIIKILLGILYQELK